MFRIVLVLALVFHCLMIMANGIMSDTVKWHPEALYISHPDMKIIFKLPPEKAQDPSGVANLFFQNRETGAIQLLDKIVDVGSARNNLRRFYNTEILSGEYNAILLYNNGNYLRYSHVVIDKNTVTEVNMQNLDIQPSNSESQNWLPLRAFNNDTRIEGILTEYQLNGRHLSVADTGRWHPEAIYFVHPEMKYTFLLPCEKDQSGVANLLFQSTETGEVHLLDTIKGNERYFNSSLIASGKYNVILLYNNGKYIRYNDFVFEKNKERDVDMEQLDVHPADENSQFWLTLRAFNTSIGDRVIRKSYTTVSERKIRGYVFDENRGANPVFALYEVTPDDVNPKKSVATTIDGYFEFDVDDDTSITLDIWHFDYFSNEVTMKANSGLILCLRSKSDGIILPDNIRTGSILYNGVQK